MAAAINIVGQVVEREQLAVDAHANIAILREFLEFFSKSAFSPAHDRREDHDAVVVLADFAVQDGLHDLFAGLARDGVAALWAMRHANGRVDYAEVIVNFRDRADSGTRRTRRGFLLDGDRRRKPFDHVDFRALHLIEELARVGRERLDVTALAFGIDGVKC